MNNNINNNRRSQSVNSNAAQLGAAFQIKNQQVSNLFQNQRGKSKQQQQFKKLQLLKLNIDDVNTLLSCYQSREDSIFQMRVCVMQMLENVQGRSLNEIQTIVRNISHILLDTERIRFQEENKVIEKYASPLIQPIFLENNSSAKQMVFRYGSKLNKINNSYYQKIQFYFPRMAELIQQEQCTWNSQFKESLQSIMSNTYQGGSGVQNTQSMSSQSNQNNSSNNNKVQLTSVLKHIVVKSRQKFQKEHVKFTCYQQAYGGLIEKIVGVPKQIDKCNKNEKFFVDKYIQGSTAFAYTQHLTQKYLIKSLNKYTTIGYSSQMRQAVRQTWKNPYDILLLEDKKQEAKAAIAQNTAGNSAQTANGTTPVLSSCVSTSKTNSNYESLWEIIVTNYDKNIKEMFSFNRSINNQIKAYIESHHKRDQQQNKSQLLLQSNIFSNKHQVMQYNKENNNSSGNNSSSQSKDFLVNDNQPKQNNQSQLSKYKDIQDKLNEAASQDDINKNLSQDLDESLVKNQGKRQREQNQLELQQDEGDQHEEEEEEEEEETQDQNLDDKSLSKSQTSPKYSISQNSVSMSHSQRNKLSQSYQTYLDEDQIKMSQSQLNQENSLQKNYKTDYCSNDNEYASDCKDQVSNNDAISVYEEFFNKQSDLNEQTSTKTQKQEDRSNSLLENSQSKTYDVQNFYSRYKHKSFQDSLGEYQFVPTKQIADFKNIIMKMEPEENSFQLPINPNKKLTNQKQGEFNKSGQDENMLQNFQMKLNSKVNLSNTQNKNKELTRVILNPFQSEIIPNSCINNNRKINEITLNKCRNSVAQSTSLKTSSSNINLSSPNYQSNINQPNIFNYQVSSANKANFEINNSLCSNKSSKIRFSLTSIQKQKDYPYIDQFNQLFESKKKNVNLSCTQSQQMNNQIQTSLANNQLSNNNIKSNTFTNDTWAYDGQDEILPPLLETNSLIKKQKQIKVFTITQREAITNQQQSESMQQKHILNDLQGHFSSHNIINSGGNTGLTTPSSNIHLTSLTKFPTDTTTQNQQNINNQHSTQNSINSYRIPNNQKSEHPSNSSSQVNIITSCTNINSSTSQNKTLDGSLNTYNNYKTNTINNQNNTPKANFQLKMNHKIYSGPTFNSLSNNKQHSQATPIKSNNLGSTKSKRQQAMSSSDQQGSLVKSINIKQVNQPDLSQLNQNQKFCNLNLDSNTHSSLYFEQQPMNLPDILYKTSQTPSIGKTQMSVPPESLHLLKQNYNNSQKKQFDISNQTGQFLNLNTSNSNQPVLTRISNAAQGSFSPLKLDSMEQRRQLSIKNNENLQLSISKRNESFNRKSINSTQNISQQQEVTQAQQTGNIFNNNITPQLKNINRQKKCNIVNLQNQNQFIIKKNQLKAYDTNQNSTLQTNKTPA